MVRGLLGKKVGMTQIFDKDGNVVPISVVETGPCTILGFQETPLKVKLGFQPIVERKLNKAENGFFKKIGVTPLKYIREFDSTNNKDYKIGQELKADLFKAGDFVDVSGTTIGKGFQGGMKRWGWKGAGAGHGSNHHRQVGSIGSSSSPSRVFVGKTMPGQMGNVRKTVQSLRVIAVDIDKNLVLIKGAVPGGSNAILEIKLSQKRAFKSLDEKKVVVQHKVNPMKQSKAKAKGK